MNFSIDDKHDCESWYDVGTNEAWAVISKAAVNGVQFTNETIQITRRLHKSLPTSATHAGHISCAHDQY